VVVCWFLRLTEYPIFYVHVKLFELVHNTASPSMCPIQYQYELSFFPPRNYIDRGWTRVFAFLDNICYFIRCPQIMFPWPAFCLHTGPQYLLLELIDVIKSWHAMSYAVLSKLETIFEVAVYNIDVFSKSNLVKIGFCSEGTKHPCLSTSNKVVELLFSCYCSVFFPNMQKLQEKLIFCMLIIIMVHI
jgi:hypothetical protein